MTKLGFCCEEQIVAARKIIILLSFVIQVLFIPTLPKECEKCPCKHTI